jgi:hypothetical protein
MISAMISNHSGRCSANAAMWALRKSGVKFRTRANELDRWQSQTAGVGDAEARPAGKTAAGTGVAA